MTTAPKGCRWDSARVDVEFHDASLRPGEFGPRRTPAFVEHVLILDKGGQPTRQVIERAVEDADDFAAMKAASYTITFAPDGHALALLRSGEARARYVALDAGDSPLYCRHAELPAQDPLSKAPATRALVLEILGSSTRAEAAAPGRNHADVFVDSSVGGAADDARFSSGPGGSDIRFLAELDGALRFAAAHDGDAEVRLAVVEALFRPGRQMGRQIDHVVQVAAQLSSGHTDVRDRLASHLGSERGQLAIEALAQNQDEASQEALGALLAQAHAAAPSEALTPRILFASWALARVTVARRAASPAVVATLSTVARGPSPCPPLRTQAQKETTSARGFAARRFALLGLAAVGSAEARKVITELAAQPCRTYSVLFDGTESVARQDQVPAWSWEVKSPAQMVDSVSGFRVDLPCQARAALKALEAK